MIDQTNLSIRTRLVVYTVLLGDKEPLGNPLALLPASVDSDIDIDFICFTDNHSLQSDVWKFSYIDSAHLPPDKLSRRPKALPHEYLPQYDVSLYIDNIVTFKRLPSSQDLANDTQYLFRVFPHATRSKLTDEADVIAILGYENVDTICAQLDFYAKLRPLETIAPLSTCTVILRNHHHPKIIEFGVLWWEQILNFSRRDQLSFDFSVLHTDCHIKPFKGFKHENNLINEMNNMDDRRIKANFDPVRYVWINRHDPLAKLNPRAHFLNNRQAICSDYSKRTALFDYICYKTNSSLGNHVAPRREVSNALGDIFNSYRELTGNMLLLQIKADLFPLAFLDEEFETAKVALGMMLSQYSGNSLTLHESDLKFSENIFSSIAIKFDLIVVFGLLPQNCQYFFDNIVRILKSDSGLMVVLMAGEIEPYTIHLAQDYITTHLAVKCKSSISHSRHDDRPNLLANSLICFEWNSVSNH